jgi:predicted O-methyltransferase YrrM
MRFEIGYFRRQRNRRLFREYQGLLPSGWQDWFDGKEFSTDWASENYPFWCATLRQLRDCPIDVLEIGSWEGRSAIFFLEYLFNSHITCVDTFSGGIENVANRTEAKEIPFIEQRFDRNLAAYGNRVAKFKGDSVNVLGRLISSGAKYDLIYVDGSHERDPAMVDTLLAWQALKTDGYLIWDDYVGGRDKPDSERVQSAIDVFLKWHKREYALMHKGYQVIIQRK